MCFVVSFYMDGFVISLFDFVLKDFIVCFLFMFYGKGEIFFGCNMYFIMGIGGYVFFFLIV